MTTVGTSVNLDAYEIGATPAGGTQVYCSYCQDWFAGWAYFMPYPPLSEVVDACKDHAATCPTSPEDKAEIDRQLAASLAERRAEAGKYRPEGWGAR